MHGEFMEAMGNEGKDREYLRVPTDAEVSLLNNVDTILILVSSSIKSGSLFNQLLDLHRSFLNLLEKIIDPPKQRKQLFQPTAVIIMWPL